MTDAINNLLAADPRLWWSLLIAVVAIVVTVRVQCPAPPADPRDAFDYDPRPPRAEGSWYAERPDGSRCPCMSGRGHGSRPGARLCARRLGTNRLIWSPSRVGDPAPDTDAWLW